MKLSRKIYGETLVWINTNVESDRALSRWVDRLRGKGVGTMYLYLRYLRLFCERFGLTPQGLYELRLREQQSPDPLDRGVVRDKTIQIMREMEEGRYDEWPETARTLLISRNQMKTLQPRAPKTCRQVAKAVTSFFETFDMDFKVKAKDKPQGSSDGQHGLTQDHCREAVKHGGRENPYRNVAVFMFLKDAGIRRGDLEGLIVGDYLGARSIRTETGETFKVFQNVRTEKEGIVAGIHLGPEAVEAIDRYLEVERPGAGPGEPLFLERDKRSGEEGPMTGGAAGLIVKRLIKLGLGPEAYKRSAHSLRKYHKTRLEAGGVPEQWVKILQGKAVDVYSKPEALELTTKYIKAYDELRVHPTIHRDVRALREELTAQEVRIAELEREKDLAEHSLDYVIERLDSHGIPVSQPEDPEKVELEALKRYVAGLIEVDPGLRDLVRTAMKKG